MELEESRRMSVEGMHICYTCHQSRVLTKLKVLLK